MIHSIQSAMAPIMPMIQPPMQETMPARQETMQPIVLRSGVVVECGVSRNTASCPRFPRLFICPHGACPHGRLTAAPPLETELSRSLPNKYKCNLMTLNPTAGVPSSSTSSSDATSPRTPRRRRRCPHGWFPNWSHRARRAHRT